MFISLQIVVSEIIFSQLELSMDAFLSCALLILLECSSYQRNIKHVTCITSLSLSDLHEYCRVHCYGNKEEYSVH